MLREQCQHCKRHSYHDGRCYADRKLKGRPISETVYCDWATPPHALPGRLLKPIKGKKTNGRYMFKTTNGGTIYIYPDKLGIDITKE